MKYILVVGLVLAALGATQVAAPPHAAARRNDGPATALLAPGTLTVMTRGLGEEPWLEAPHAVSLSARTPARPGPSLDLAARARRLADEVQDARPHLIGLQQVMEVRPRPESTPEGELLPRVFAELEARGLHYREVARVRNADLELAVRPGESPPGDGSSDGSGPRVRLTDHDVILARADVEVTQVRAGHYPARREVRVPGLGAVELPRGWVSVVAQAEGRRYRFVSTHLEPAPDDEGLRVQLAQTEALLGELRGEVLPVVLVGDFNTPANLGRMGAPTYRELLLAGYEDVWTRRVGGTLALEERPHLVLVRSPVSPSPRRLGPVLAYGVGGLGEGRPDEPWRTDMSGVVARLLLPASARH